MQIKKVVKKVSAFSAGVLMVGATMSMAFAQTDLGDYPHPFINSEGVLEDTVIVVGARAGNADIIGAIDIAASLQAAAVTVHKNQDEEDSNSMKSLTLNGFRIDDLSFGEMLNVTLDHDDLPNILGEGTVVDNKGRNKNNEDYEQTLQVKGNFNFFEANDNDRPEKTGDYLMLEDMAYTYKLMIDAMSFDADNEQEDFNGVVIQIQGKDYLITEVSEKDDMIDKMTLIAGDTTASFVQDVPQTIDGVTIQVVDITTGNDEECGFIVGGVQHWVDVGTNTEVTVDGESVTIGVISIKAPNTKDSDTDICELSIGSSEVTLEDGSEVRVNGESIEGSKVEFDSESETWKGFSVEYSLGEAEEGVNSEDETFLGKGDSWVDPVFGVFEISYAGYDASEEEIVLEEDGDEATLTFNDVNGNEVVIPFNITGDNFIGLGENGRHLFYAHGDANAIVVHEDSSLAEGMLIVSTENGETIVLEIEDFEFPNFTLSQHSGEVEFDDKDVKVVGSTNVIIEAEETHTFTFTNTNDKIMLSDAGASNLKLTEFETEKGATIEIKSDVPTNKKDKIIVTVKGDTKIESNITIKPKQGEKEFRFEINQDDDEDATNGYGNLLQVESEDDDNDWYVTNMSNSMRGTRTMISDDDDKVVIYFPEEDVEGVVYVSPVSADDMAMMKSDMDEDAPVRVNPFSVGLAVLDVDATNLRQNMIVVGGPCANQISADLQERTPETCSEGYEEGKAIIKLFRRDGYVAILVAGATAQDTTGAARVLADYNNRELDGDEVSVTVPSLDEITVTSG